MARKKSDEEAEKKQYRAPALIKGLDILELLGRQSEPLTLSEISEKLERSKNEIFRMVRALEDTGYIAQVETGEGYEITSKLFLLGMEKPPTATLLEAALPAMREFSANTDQSCHIAISSRELIVVIARIQSGGPVSFSVRVGHRQLLSQSTSGLILYAWMVENDQEKYLSLMQETDPKFDKRRFVERAKFCKEQGFLQKTSRFVEGVVDIAAPILVEGVAVASLTAPCIKRLDVPEGARPPIEELLEAADRISKRISPIL